MPRPLRKIQTFKVEYNARYGWRAVGYDSRGRSVNYLEGDLTTTEAQMRRAVKQHWPTATERLTSRPAKKRVAKRTAKKH